MKKSDRLYRIRRLEEELTYADPSAAARITRKITRLKASAFAEKR